MGSLGAHDVGTYDCPECGSSLRQDQADCPHCGWVHESVVPGFYVTVEGIDGSGTTSVVTALGMSIDDAETIAEPTTSWTGEVVRESFEERDVRDLTRFYLFMADRAELQDRLDVLLDIHNRVVISDRGPDSTEAYQYHTAGLSEDFLARNLNETARVPDLTLWLDVGVETAADRMCGDDAFEKDWELQEKVADRYEYLWTKYDRIERIDATQPLDDVVAEAKTAISNRRDDRRQRILDDAAKEGF